MTRQVTERAKALAREFEQYRSVAYKPTPDDVWTLGYGHTLGVDEGDTCTKRLAEIWLTEDFQRAAKALERKIGSVVKDLTDNQHDAMCDFVFNLGTGDPTKPEWKIWGLLRARAFDQIPAQLARFVYQKKTKLRGLVRRRNADIELWSEDEPGSADEEVHSAVTRFVETPPAPAEKPKSAPLVTAAVSACATVPVAVKAVTDAVEPFADKSPVVGQVIMALATIAALATVVMLGLAWLQRQQAKR